ncbi:MAG: tRNA 2-thiouridine(34) synthase MnmA [Desulfovibrio sp.]
MKVAVGVSGGADSLLSLIRLKEEGYEVVAVHGRFLAQEGAREEAALRGLEERCASLSVPLHVLDLRSEFETCVIKYFEEEYAIGRTPNPCVLCNARIKFGLFMDAALELGVDKVATGHYVRTAQYEGVGTVLARGVDNIKDQSYFLSLVEQHRIDKCIFPLGSTTKNETHGELEERKIVPPVPSESQEICFVPDDDYRAFLKGRGVDLPVAGNICLEDSTVLGQHQGVWQYTQGQRKGLGVAWREPLYVIDKDLDKNVLIVGPKPDLATDGCIVSKMNYMVPQELWPETLLVQTRYRQQARPTAFLAQGDGGARLDFLEPHARPTPGQIASIYTTDGIVLAGGIIDSSLDR